MAGPSLEAGGREQGKGVWVGTGQWEVTVSLIIQIISRRIYVRK